MPTGRDARAVIGTVLAMRSLLAAGAVAVSAGLLVGCASGDPEPAQQPAQMSSPPTVTATSPSSPPTTNPPTTEAAPGTTLTIGGSEFGEVLFDSTGQAVYLFGREETGTPVCYDECAVEWPPVLTEGTPVAPPGAAADAIGTTVRTDGSIQVTFGGHPLYSYAHEGKHEVLCHNVSEFGGLWLALAPTGEPAAS